MTGDSSSFAGRAGLWQRIFAWAMSLGGPADLDAAAVPYKRRLLGDLTGHVVEVGPGTGTNFAFLPPGIRWTGFEPNVYMHPYLRRTLRAYPHIAADIRTGTAEQLDLPDASADAVITTLVLCSVTDQPRALAEIRRVLKPGGRFVFIEHVAAPPGSGLRRAQRLIKPVWRRLGDGCHPDRETWMAIQQAGFSMVEMERFSAPYPIASPHIAGYAIK